MTTQSVCAVIVTYHPSTSILEHTADVLAQVQGLAVVDNGSGADDIESLRSASRRQGGFHLIENGKNLGIAEALNQGIRWAKDEGYRWVVLFDQDSKVTEGFIREMFAAWESYSERERVASVYPRYANPDTGVELSVPRAADNSPILPMTSGTLMPVWIFDRIGWFASEYFIDVVDWEYGFRIRAAGYLLLDAKHARLLHAAGFPTETAFLGRTFQSSQHSAVRRYYISRNCIAFYRKYFFRFPGWILKCMYKQMRDIVVSSFAEEDRWLKFRNFLLGTWDGLTGKMGERKAL
ncbi:MAG TPA: glycosyltransferase family 2 protein [Candidatus Sulfotelmatobacter sp.]|nr:glycosyltransferase family 2 protein [Candidatus Sulfotelmatobacter sp.]